MRTRTDSRRLAWEGCLNVRDLGGLATADGRMTRSGGIVRADAPNRLSSAGWRALEEYGIRTVVDLRNDDELAPDLAPRPGSIETVHLALDGVEETEFWAEWTSGPQFGTPLYYAPFLERFPERPARVIEAIADARPGGVLVHCVGGRDRTGLISVLVLALAGVTPEEIAADYEFGATAIGSFPERLGEIEQIDRFLRDRGTSTRELILELLAAIDVVDHLRAAGLGEEPRQALRSRLIASPVSHD